MRKIQIQTIGEIVKDNQDFTVALQKDYIPALKNIEGFSHLQVIWWAHLTDQDDQREKKVLGKLFKNGPDEMGIFATRSPIRPNPIMISNIKVSNLDVDKGFIHTPFIDADPGTPVLDIKPYQPMERIQFVGTPEWCKHWPKWQEESVGFDWSKEINI